MQTSFPKGLLMPPSPVNAAAAAAINAACVVVPAAAADVTALYLTINLLTKTGEIINKAELHRSCARARTKRDRARRGAANGLPRLGARNARASKSDQSGPRRSLLSFAA